MKKNKGYFIVLSFIFLLASCQTNKTVFHDSDFEKIKKHDDGWVLGEIPLKIDFRKVLIKDDIFYAEGNIMSENTLEKLAGVSILIKKKDQEEKKLYETKEDGFF